MAVIMPCKMLKHKYIKQKVKKLEKSTENWKDWASSQSGQLA